MPLRPALGTKVSAHEGTRAFKLIKDLVLEVFGFPLTLPSNLAQHPAPWPGQLNKKRYLLDAKLARTTQQIAPRLWRQPRFLLTSFLYQRLLGDASRRRDLAEKFNPQPTGPA
jgi:hypothetical protein